MTALSDLHDCQSVIDSAWSYVAAPALAAAIDVALAVPAPDGSPDVISEQGSSYRQAGSTCSGAASDLNEVAANKLPAAWRGDVGETASEAVGALSAETSAAASVLRSAGETLATWADNLESAQREDRAGRSTLQSAKHRLGPLGGLFSGLIEFADPADFVIAVEEARAGIASMVDAASRAQTSGQAAASMLTYLTDQARAQRVDADGLNPLDAVVLAAEQNAAADGGGDILTAAELTRSSQLLNRMPAAQQREFEELLADARSPEEAAYLMKALAAGNSLSAIEQFDALIHPHGNDPVWLSEHLAPDLADDSYEGQGSPGASGYAQGDVGDCVAASTVVALANLDPVYMLKLTTGDHGGVLGFDSPLAFTNRLQQAYISQYQQGQRAGGDPSVYPKVDKGLGSAGETALANSDLGKATGLHYQFVSLSGSSDNQAVLPQIQKAVDAGQPVPIDVTDHNGDNHQMIIIGSNGNMLEIYNPWGVTGWVTAQQFVNNQLGSLTSLQPVMPAAYAVELPSR
jgi:uncharacterized protein YukE